MYRTAPNYEAEEGVDQASYSCSRRLRAVRGGGRTAIATSEVDDLDWVVTHAELDLERRRELNCYRNPLNELLLPRGRCQEA